MCAGRLIGGRTLAPSLLGMLCLLAGGSLSARGDEAASDTVLWDTRSVSGRGGVDFGEKDRWRRIGVDPAARRLPGDAVVENQRLTVVFCRQAGGPLIRPKSAIASENDKTQLIPVAPNGEPATRLSEIEIRKNDEDEITLEVCSRTESGQEICTAYSLSRGQAFLECRPIRNAARILLEAATRFAVIPDFFGADMVFDPRAYARSRLTIPPENLVLGLLDGHRTIVMSVWPTADQQAELILGGAQGDRRIASLGIAFRGKGVYVAVLHAPGIWHEHPLREPYVDRDIALGWNSPFPAKWRANFCLQRRNDSWDFQDHKTSTWMYLYQAMAWPCWFDGQDGWVRFSRRFIDVKGPMEFVLVYPSDRTKATPLSALTPVDIVRGTLGVGPCEYVLDREGLQGRSANTGRKSFGRGVCDTTTPIEYLFMEGIEARESGLVGHLVDDILADIHAIHARVLEFCRFGKELGKLAAGMPHPSRPAASLVAESQKTAREIESLYQEKLAVIKNPAHADQIGRRIKELASRSDPENLGECKTLTRQLRDIAGTQHRMVGDYRVMVKRLRQEAGILGAEDPSMAKMAEQARKLGGQVLRKKYGVEAD